MNWEKSENRRLIKAFLAIKTEDEARRFLCDLMTRAEIVEFSNRLRAAEMLSEKSPYSLVEQVTGMSSTTVARVQRWLKQGKGGYKMILERLKEKQ